MVATYRHFKKHEEVFFGLSFFTLAKVIALVASLVLLAFNLKLSLNSPLLLFLAIVWMIIAAIIIKSDSGDEVGGFYSSFLTHPFKNHIFPLFSPLERRSPALVEAIPDWVRSKNPFMKAKQAHETEFNIDGSNQSEAAYTSISKIQNIKAYTDDLLISKDGDLIASLKLDNGVSWSNTSETERKRFIESWGRLLAQFQSINSMNSYFKVNDAKGDSIQAFIWAKPYKQEENYQESQEPEQQDISDSQVLSESYQKEWQQRIFSGEIFIPNLEFYLIIRHKISKTKIHPAYKFLKKLFPGWLSADLSLMTHSEFEEEKDLLQQKIDAIQSSLQSMEIKSKLMKSDEVLDFASNFIPLKKILDCQEQTGKQAEINTTEELIDKSKYLDIKLNGKQKITKTYRLHLPPEDGELDAWLINYFSLLETESSISVHWIPRDALEDRRSAERKADLMVQMAKSSKSSTAAIIRENKAIAEDLVNQPYSFDLVVYITVICKSIDELQKIDNRLRRPVHSAVLSPLDRQQVQNWLYSLPFAFNKLKNKDKLFASKSFAQSCFPFFKSELGTKKGPLLGLSLEDMRPIFLDEYDRQLCNNRGINFIGDSGSGKTVAAKLAVKRRLEQGGSFIIVDNTQDGWQFFMDFYGGTVIDIDTSISSDGKTFFTPFKINEDYSINELNAHIERLSKLLTTIKERSTDLAALEEVFIFKSLQELYESHKSPILSDLYKLWKSKEMKLREEFEDHYFREWAEVIAPYCKCCNGIYAGLMDSNESKLSSQDQLILFTFSKIDSDSNFLPVSLFLVANYVSRRVIFQKETKVTFIVDEAWKMFSGKNSQKGKELLSYFARAGRGMDLGLWTISQKPKDLPREIHSSASATLVFQLKESHDRQDMVSMANLKEHEKKLLEIPEMAESGTCLVKTTRSSGLIKVLLDPLEEVLCNSTRDFVNQREALFLDELNKSNDHSDRESAALNSAQQLITIQSKELSHAK